jgi:hypothetical protein
VFASGIDRLSQQQLVAPAGQKSLAGRAAALYRERRAMNENFSLVVMCIFLLLSLAFLAQQLTSYH